MNEGKPIAKQGPPQIIPKLLGKKVTIRMLSGGQPIIGTIQAYNPYEILVRTAKGDTIIPKRAMVVIELTDSLFS